MECCPFQPEYPDHDTPIAAAVGQIFPERFRGYVPGPTCIVTNFFVRPFHVISVDLQLRMIANIGNAAQLRTVGWHETTLWPEIQEAAAFYAAASRFFQTLVLLFASLFPATLPS